MHNHKHGLTYAWRKKKRKSCCECFFLSSWFSDGFDDVDDESFIVEAQTKSRANKEQQTTCSRPHLQSDVILTNTNTLRQEDTKEDEGEDEDSDECHMLMVGDWFGFQCCCIIIITHFCLSFAKMGDISSRT